MDKSVESRFECDAETGNDFFEARYYRDILGRFTSPDPVTGWRIHLAWNPEFAKKVAKSPKFGPSFWDRVGRVSGTHTAFGFTQSFREKGRQPSLQLVFTNDFRFSDADLDVGHSHRSSPTDVWPKLSDRWPEVFKR